MQSFVLQRQANGGGGDEEEDEVLEVGMLGQVVDAGAELVPASTRRALVTTRFLNVSIKNSSL